MHIVCPRCTTSYAIDLATFGASGRTVRCSRCKEVWLARPEDAIELAAAVPAAAAAGGDEPPPNGSAWPTRKPASTDTPVVESPSISADWPADDASQPDWQSAAQDEADDLAAQPRRGSRLLTLLKPPALFRMPGLSLPKLPSPPCRPPAPRWARCCWRW